MQDIYEKQRKTGEKGILKKHILILHFPLLLPVVCCPHELYLCTSATPYDADLPCLVLGGGGHFGSRYGMVSTLWRGDGFTKGERNRAMDVFGYKRRAMCVGSDGLACVVSLCLGVVGVVRASEGTSGRVLEGGPSHMGIWSPTRGMAHVRNREGREHVVHGVCCCLASVRLTSGLGCRRGRRCA